jgi:hypothetical protein
MELDINTAGVVVEVNARPYYAKNLIHLKNGTLTIDDEQSFPNAFGWGDILEVIRGHEDYLILPDGCNQLIVKAE